MKTMKLPKRILAFVLAIAAIILPATAQQPAGPPVLTSQLVKDGVYQVEGGMSRSGFIVGDTGVVVFDTQRAKENAKLVIAEIAKVTSKPIVAIVVSHADPDHVAGLPAFPVGVPIIAHENTKAEIRISAADPGAGPVWGPVYKELLDFLPTRTIGATETVTLAGMRMVLMYVAPAHTSGDLILYLPDRKVVFAGDVITTNTGPMPIIHHHSGGTSLGWIATMKAILALDADTYIPGHGAMWSKDKLQAWVRDVETRRAEIKAMVGANKSLEEIRAALPERGASPMFPTFAQTTYDELTKGYPPAGPPWLNLVRPMPGAAQAPAAAH